MVQIEPAIAHEAYVVDALSARGAMFVEVSGDGLGGLVRAWAAEILVPEVVDRLATRYAVREREVAATIERMIFKLPRGLAA